MENLGICPSCGKGQMRATDKGYGCSHFKSNEDKCTFFVYKEMFGKEITEEILAQIIANKQTEFFSDLKSKEGKIFSGRLVVADGFLKPSFLNETLETACPYCGDSVEIGFKGYFCVKTRSSECDFYLPKIVASRELSVSEAEVLASGKKTDILDGFVRTDGKEFSASLFLNADKELKFDSSIGDCPKCKTGKLLANPRAFSCSNFREESIKCDFVVWREMQGKSIGQKEVLQLLKKGVSGVIKGFKKGDETYSGKLVLEDFKVKIVV